MHHMSQINKDGSSTIIQSTVYTLSTTLSKFPDPNNYYIYQWQFINPNINAIKTVIWVIMK